jgi:hypothetical protein
VNEFETMSSIEESFFRLLTSFGLVGIPIAVTMLLAIDPRFAIAEP